MLSYLSKIINFNKLNIVGIVKTDESSIYHLLSIEKKDSKLLVKGSRSFSSFDKLLEVIDQKTPLLLTIDGKGVLNKRIEYGNENDENWLKTIDFNSVYHTTYQENETSYISFCRINLVEEILNTLQQKSFEVLDIFIGSFSGALLKNSIKQTNFISGELLLTFEEDELVAFSKNNQKNPTYLVGTDSILSSHIPLYASAIQFYLKPEEITKSQTNKINLEEIVYKKAFNLFGVTMLIVFFVSLLISFFLIQYYGNKNADLNLQNLYSNQSYKQLQQLEKKREQQLLILNESGLASNTFFSHYTFDLLKTIPSNIKLNELNCSPMNKEFKAEKKILLTGKTIIIKGQTAQEEVFNSWLNSIKTISWVKKFEIVSLKRDKKNVSQFEVKILI